jgi:hypothetical protein
MVSVVSYALFTRKFLLLSIVYPFRLCWGLVAPQLEEE